MIKINCSCIKKEICSCARHLRTHTHTQHTNKVYTQIVYIWEEIAVQNLFFINKSVVDNVLQTYMAPLHCFENENCPHICVCAVHI